jgi:hypothetical protein
MEDYKVKLSMKGLANILMIASRNDFEFVVGESHYRCPFFAADFLSPKIARLDAIDATIENFVISSEDRNNESPSFLSLGRGSFVSINSTNRDFLLSLSSELENLEFFILISHGMNCSVELTVESALGRLSDLSRFSSGSDSGIDFDFDFSKEIGFLASNLHGISNSQLLGLSLSILSEILSSPDLKITSEDDLYSKVWDLIKRDRSHFSLLSFIHSIRIFALFDSCSLCQIVIKIH